MLSAPFGGRSSVVEHWIVAPRVAGSNPVVHPNKEVRASGLTTKHAKEAFGLRSEEHP